MRVDVDSSRAAAGFYKITPHGSINAQNTPEFESALDPLLGSATKVILADLSDVEYVSSAGLQVIFGTKKILVSRGGDLLFCNLRPQIVKLFQVVNALPKESIFASVEEADRYFYAIMNREIERQKGNV